YFSTIFCLFFFSSRRRHTRFSRDWSSDVCSSDLFLAGSSRPSPPFSVVVGHHTGKHAQRRQKHNGGYEIGGAHDASSRLRCAARSEERRVGKGGTAGRPM